MSPKCGKCPIRPSFKNILLAEVADLEIYEHTMLKNSFRIENGLAYVPAGVGLGVEIDLDALAKYRIELP